MEQEQAVEFGVLNIAAHPHPTGVYERLFDVAAETSVQFYGDMHGTITAPQKDRDGFLYGRIVIWTHVDEDDDIIDTEKKEEASEEVLASMNIPPNVGVNGRFFHYVFRIKDHRLFFETLNEQQKRLSVRRAERLIARLFSPENLGADSPIVEVTPIPEDDALERILRLRRLSRLEIELKRPNADDESEYAHQILAEMEEQQVQRQKVVLTAQPGTEGIQANARTTAQAKLAEHNGYVKGSGADEDGEKVSLSTKEYPKTYRRVLGPGASAFAALLAVALAIISGKSE